VLIIIIFGALSSPFVQCAMMLVVELCALLEETERAPAERQREELRDGWLTAGPRRCMIRQYWTSHTRCPSVSPGYTSRPPCAPWAGSGESRAEGHVTRPHPPRAPARRHHVSTTGSKAYWYYYYYYYYYFLAHQRKAAKRRQENWASDCTWLSTKLWLQRQLSLWPWCCGKKPHFLLLLCFYTPV